MLQVVTIREQEYRLRNTTAGPLAFVVEHPLEKGWTVARIRRREDGSGGDGGVSGDGGSGADGAAVCEDAACGADEGGDGCGVRERAAEVDSFAS